MPAHIHAELMKQYAEDALTTDKPWELWEVEEGRHEKVWRSLEAHPLWHEQTRYRRKPRTININGHEVPEPMRVQPKYGDKYFSVDTRKDSLVSLIGWECDEFDRLYFNRGLCHSTKEAAEAHARALLSFTEVKA